MSGRILVTYGTKHGSTREVAETVAEALNGLGVDVTTRPAGEIDDLVPYTGVVIGGALYTGRWHRDSVRFLKTHRSSLESMPVAVFAIGPQTAAKHDLEASRAQLDKALERFPGIRPRSVAVFGGVIDPNALRFPFSRMPASDARDWEAIRAWAEEIAASFGLRKSRIQREGSPQRASADAPMRNELPLAMLAPQGQSSRRDSAATKGV